MREILTELILNFYGAQLPTLKSREIVVQELPRNASILVGMRRTGKTFRVFQLIRDLLASGVPRERMLYLNFDDERLAGLATRDLSLIPEIFYHAYPENVSEQCYFFLDEIQDVANWEVFVRRLIDSGHIQVVLTGSSSKLLSSEISTTMRGRSVETEVFPLSFAEYLKYHSILDRIPRLVNTAARAKIKHALDSYFLQGGFPEVQECSQELWASKLQSYTNEVLFRDLVERYGISNVQALQYILRKAVQNPGGQMSANAIYRELKGNGYKVDRESIGNYIKYFCQAYLMFEVPFHSESLAQRMVNPPKIYLVDVGLVRAMTSKHSADQGFLLENLVFLHLRRKGFELKYLVTREGYEVDFVACSKFEHKYHLIQVSYAIDSEKTRDREVRALTAAAKLLQPVRMAIVTWDTEMELAAGIRVIPAWKFLLDLE